MRCAMILRIWDMGTRSPGITAGAGAEAGRGAGAATGAAVRRSTKSRTSCLVTRPPVPVPLTFARSTLCSRASLRTSGEERTSESSSSSVALAAGGGGGSGSATAVANHTHDGVDLNGVAFGNLDFLKDSAGGRGDFGVDLVGGNLEQRFVALDLVTGLFQPLGDGPFENRFAHLGHDYVGRHSSLSMKPFANGGGRANTHYSEAGSDFRAQSARVCAGSCVVQGPRPRLTIDAISCGAKSDEELLGGRSVLPSSLRANGHLGPRCVLRQRAGCRDSRRRP